MVTESVPPVLYSATEDTAVRYKPVRDEEAAGSMASYAAMKGSMAFLMPSKLLWKMRMLWSL